jgi:hypothetical protein
MSRLNTATTKTFVKDDQYLHIYDESDSIDKNMRPSILLQGALQINDIVNGNLDIWQRQTNFTGITDGNYTADRFGYEKSGTMVHDIVRDSSIIPTNNFNFSLKVDCTTADASISAGEYCTITHIIEGYNFKKYVDGYGTLGFWVRSAKTGIHCISFRNDGKDRSYIVEYTVNVANTWEYKTITVLFNELAGTWDYENGAGLRISWALAAGATFQTTKDTWQTGNFFGTSNQVNVCDNIANNFYVTGITFNIGRIPILSNIIDFDYELSRCQRYYEKSYNQSIFPGAVSSVGALAGRQSGADTNCTSLQNVFNTKKRATPTIKWYSDVTGTADRIRNVTGAADGTVTSTTNEGEYSSGYPVISVAIADGNEISGHYTADAEISI